MLVRLIETEKTVGRFMNAIILEADDGATAIEMVRTALENGERFDFILMDYIMVLYLLTILCVEGL